jgi:hypothetical protein
MRNELFKANAVEIPEKNIFVLNKLLQETGGGAIRKNWILDRNEPHYFFLNGSLKDKRKTRGIFFLIT